MNLFAGWQRAAAALLVLGSSSLVAAPALRVSVDQHGDFALIGNTLGQECAAGTPLHHDGRIVPSFDGRRIVQLGIQSRDFYVKEAAAFIEFLYAFGAARGVRWSEP